MTPAGTLAPAGVLPPGSRSWFRELLALYDCGFASRVRTWQRWYAGTPYEYVERFVPSRGNVVDLGCGWGIFANLLALKSPDRTVHGIDLDSQKISWAQRTVGTRPHIHFAVRDLTTLKLERTDAIVIYDVLHHLEGPDQLAVLRESFRQLAPGGKLILKENDVVPRWKLLVSHLVEMVALGFNITLSRRILFRSRAEWRRLLEETGFRVTHEEHLKTPYGFFVPHALFVAEKV